MKAAVLELESGAPMQVRLERTLQDLAAFGDKRCGTVGGHRSAAYLLERFREAGLTRVRLEPFRFPSYELIGSSFLVDGLPVPHEAFAYSGLGAVEGRLVHVGTGEAADYEDREVRGSVVIVERNITFHRSAQYREAIERGAVALIYVSHAPGNLIQNGTISDPEDGLGSIPAISVGEKDGRRLIALAQAGRARASVEVSARLSSGVGYNVVGELPGAGPALLIGAHHDTWHVGSTDNGTGVAVLCELAEQLARTPRRRAVTFVAWDGEELGLFGGYDFLRKHVSQGGYAAFVNLEIPGAGPDDIRAVAHTHALEACVKGNALDELYPVCVGMEVVAGLFGGVVPTDIQGAYRWGLPGCSTACDSPWYHTTEDTPDKVDVQFLARAAARWRRTLHALDALPDSAFQRDPNLFTVQVSTERKQDGLEVEVRALRGDGSPAAAANVDVIVDVDDFTRAFRARLVSDANGFVRVRVPQTALAAGEAGRYLHVTAGENWPLAEQVLALD